MRKLNHLYRIAATGLCFFCFGIGGLVLSLLVLPLQRILIRDRQQRRIIARRTVHHAFAFFLGLIRWVGAFNFELTAKAQLQQANSKIIIANHPSLIDVVALIAMVPNADCVVKAQLFRNPFMRGVINSTGYISNSDPDQLLDDCAASLAQGNNLIIFPEGTRSKPGQPLHFQRGAANIALRSGCDYLALQICCQPSTLTKEEQWYNVPSTKPTLAIHFLKSISISEYCNISSPSLAARQLTRDIENFYQQILS